MKGIATIYYDAREEGLKPREEVVTHLRRLGAPVKKKVLEIGDYVVPTEELSIAVEFKNAIDYVNSMIDGRLNNQQSHLSNLYDSSVVLVEGSIPDAIQYRNIGKKNIFSSLAGVIVKRSPSGKRGAISLAMVDDKFEAALLIYYIWNKLNKGDIHRLPEIKLHKTSTENISIAILSGFPGVGKKRAKMILGHFGNLRAVFMSNTAGLMSVAGIGKKTAEEITATLNARVNV